MDMRPINEGARERGMPIFDAHFGQRENENETERMNGLLNECGRLGDEKFLAEDSQGGSMTGVVCIGVSVSVIKEKL